MELYQKKYMQVFSKNQEVVQRSDKLREEIQRVKESVEEKQRAMARMLLPPSPLASEVNLPTNQHNHEEEDEGEEEGEGEGSEDGE